MEFSTTVGNKDYQDIQLLDHAFHGYAQGTNMVYDGKVSDWWQSMTMDSQVKIIPIIPTAEFTIEIMIQMQIKK